MARTPEDITNAELAVMNVIWERGPMTTREHTSILYPSGNRTHYAFLQGLLNRLERKAFIKRDRKPSAHLFEPKIDCEQLIGRHLQTIADKLCGGSVIPLLRHLVNANLTSEQLGRVRELIQNVQKARGDDPEPFDSRQRTQTNQN